MPGRCITSLNGWHMGREAVPECTILFLGSVHFFLSPNSEREGGISNAQCPGASAHKPIQQSSYMVVPKYAETHFGWWLCTNRRHSARMGTIDGWGIVQMGIGAE